MRSNKVTIYSTLSSDKREIRVLSLYPGNLADEIRCELHTASLDENPTYEALSYTWGSATHNRAILLNGQAWSVTANLESALRRLRENSGALRTLWIDALCINQSDIAEREKQVNIMRYVYQQARDVLVWLGEWTPTMRGRGEAMLQALDSIHQLAAGRHVGDIPLLVPPSSSPGPAGLGPQHEALSALQFIMQNPYWSRAWTVQETIVANHATVLCAEFSAEFEDFLRAARNYGNHSTTNCCFNSLLRLRKEIAESMYQFCERIQLMHNIRDRFRGDGPSLQLWEVLSVFRSRRSTDPRDKIYAFLGLVTEWPHGRLIPINYSVQTADLFKMTAFKIIEGMQNLTLLSLTGASRTIVSLPSWVPDWTCGDQGSSEIGKSLLWQMFYKAAGPISVQPALFGESILASWGVKISVVSDVVQPRGSAPETLHGWHEKLVSTRSNIQANDEMSYLSAGDWEDVFLRTIICDFITPFRNAALHEELVAYRRARPEDIAILKGMVSRLYLDPPSMLPTESAPAAEKEFWKSFADATAGRVFFTTSNTHMGVGPSAMRYSDEVWVLMGSPVPFVLRKVEVEDLEEPTDLWLMIGPCYLHGIMDGEAIMDGDTLKNLEGLQIIGLI